MSNYFVFTDETGAYQRRPSDAHIRSHSFDEVLILDELQYGPILVTKGLHKGRIGIYDDEDDSNPNQIIIYPNDPTFCKNSYTVKQSAVTSVIPTECIAKRWEEIEHALYCDCFENTLDSQETIALLHERIYSSKHKKK